MAERMIIRNGEVELEGGKAESIDFQNCRIYIDSTSRLVNCTIDAECEVVGTDGK